MTIAEYVRPRPRWALYTGDGLDGPPAGHGHGLYRVGDLAPYVRNDERRADDPEAFERETLMEGQW